MCADHTFKDSKDIKARDHRSEQATEMTLADGRGGEQHSGRPPAFSALVGGGEVINDGMD